MDGAAFRTDTFDGKTVTLIIPAAKNTILFIRQAVALLLIAAIAISLLKS